MLPLLPLLGMEGRDNGLLKISFGILLGPALRRNQDNQDNGIVRWVSLLAISECLNAQSVKRLENIYKTYCLINLLLAELL